jgi:hypothetical protein
MSAMVKCERKTFLIRYQLFTSSNMNENGIKRVFCFPMRTFICHRERERARGEMKGKEKKFFMLLNMLKFHWEVNITRGRRKVPKEKYLL